MSKTEVFSVTRTCTAMAGIQCESATNDHLSEVKEQTYWYN